MNTKSNVTNGFRKLTGKFLIILMGVLLVTTMSVWNFAFGADTNAGTPIREVHKVTVEDNKYCFFVTRNVVLTPAEIKGMTDEELTAEIRRLNSILSCKGLRVLPLKYKDGRALIYIYRPAQLENDLSGELSCRLLRRSGYSQAGCMQCIRELVRRLGTSKDFPHEIGLFLGYPPEDVDGFIEHGARDCKCVGTWKVYGDEAKARRTFARYKKCTELYLRQLRRGSTLEKLAVKVSS